MQTSHLHYKRIFEQIVHQEVEKLLAEIICFVSVFCTDLLTN